MAFSFSIPDIKADLVGLIKSLELIKLNYKSREAIYKLLSTNSKNSDVNETMKTLGLSSTNNPPGSAVFKFVESLPKLLPEIINDNPDYETKMKIDNNFIFSIIIAKTINKIIDEYLQEFNKFTEAERNEILQNLIDSEKNNEAKFKDQFIQLQKIENEKREQLLIILLFLQAMKQRQEELLQLKIELVIDLKKNISGLLDKVFTTVDGKPLLTEKARNEITDNISNFLIQNISDNNLKKAKDPEWLNRKKYEPGRLFPPANDNKIDVLDLDSLRVKSEITRIIEEGFSQNGIIVDKEFMSININIIVNEIKSDNGMIKKGLEEISSVDTENSIIANLVSDKTDKISNIIGEENLNLDVQYNDDDDLFNDDRPGM